MAIRHSEPEAHTDGLNVVCAGYDGLSGICSVGGIYVVETFVRDMSGSRGSGQGPVAQVSEGTRFRGTVQMNPRFRVPTAEPHADA